MDSDHLKEFVAQIKCEIPNQHLYEFSGNLIVNNNIKDGVSSSS